MRPNYLKPHMSRLQEGYGMHAIASGLKTLHF